MANPAPLLAKLTLRQTLWNNIGHINFGIACTALLFQTTVLYPWHIQLEKDFTELKKSHEEQLDAYHKLKLQRLDSIEEKLTQIHPLLTEVASKQHQ